MASLQLFFLVVLFFSTMSSCLSYEPRNPEVEALMSIRKELIDPHGVLSNWDEDSVDPCSWSMITCSNDNLVIGLGAPSQSLSGTLSSTIRNLTNLTQLVSYSLLQNNNISGSIPPELGLLWRLQTVDLSNNRFSGQIPESFGHLTSLQYLRLNNNSLSGPFPDSLAKIKDLAFLDLSYNNLTGPVPKFHARTFNIIGNPVICRDKSHEGCSPSTFPLPLFSSLNSSGFPKFKRLAIALGVSFSFATVALLGIAFLTHRRNKQSPTVVDINDTEELFVVGVGNLQAFPFKELQSATDNFSSKNILGAGGFGYVYRGKLVDGTAVAVKRLKDIRGTTGESQFRTELEMISLAVHRNLLKLIGYCATDTERILVYPYMSNGSVASRLKKKPVLDWITRKRIAIGAARGLLYLHEQCDPKIIHRDVKAANVLLDEFCESVVGDFGLAKLLEHDDTHVTTAVRGTVGHIAPEYLSTGQSSEKTDVYGFGILLVELITGRRALGKMEWVKQIHQENKLELLVDKELGSIYDGIEVEEMLQVAILCTQYSPAHRPKMSDVVRMLEGDGLAEKWADTHNHIKPTLNFSLINKATKDVKYDDDDEHSLDTYGVELSGPR